MTSPSQSSSFRAGWPSVSPSPPLSPSLAFYSASARSCKRFDEVGDVYLSSRAQDGDARAILSDSFLNAAEEEARTDRRHTIDTALTATRGAANRAKGGAREKEANKDMMQAVVGRREGANEADERAHHLLVAAFEAAALAVEAPVADSSAQSRPRHATAGWPASAASWPMPMSSHSSNQPSVRAAHEPPRAGQSAGHPRRVPAQTPAPAQAPAPARAPALAFLASVPRPGEGAQQRPDARPGPMTAFPPQPGQQASRPSFAGPSSSPSTPPLELPPRPLLIPARASLATQRHPIRSAPHPPPSCPTTTTIVLTTNNSTTTSATDDTPTTTATTTQASAGGCSTSTTAAATSSCSSSSSSASCPLSGSDREASSLADEEELGEEETTTSLSEDDDDDDEDLFDDEYLEVPSSARKTRERTNGWEWVRRSSVSREHARVGTTPSTKVQAIATRSRSASVSAARASSSVTANAQQSQSAAPDGSSRTRTRSATLASRGVAIAEPLIPPPTSKAAPTTATATPAGSKVKLPSKFAPIRLPLRPPSRFHRSETPPAPPSSLLRAAQRKRSINERGRVAMRRSDPRPSSEDGDGRETSSSKGKARSQSGDDDNERRARRDEDQRAGEEAEDTDEEIEEDEDDDGAFVVNKRKCARTEDGRVWTVSPNLNLVLLELTPYARATLCKKCNQQIPPCTYRIQITHGANEQKTRGPPTGERRKWHVSCYESEYALENPNRMRLFFPSSNFVDDTALELVANWCRVRNGLPPLTRQQMAYAAWGDEADSKAHAKWWEEPACFVYTSNVHLSRHGGKRVKKSRKLNDIDICEVSSTETLTQLLRRIKNVPKRFSPGHPLRKLMPATSPVPGFLRLGGVTEFDQWYRV
ncbi:uncharacterized protein PFL1_03076 [Pseudozyma flocculosa PF-1]|uniref:Uncharacterized protein n=2 Tax=Pseudozyma flocculosa TaxID=84751 RepID=A0A5C3F1T2_9BASI|nr:uncharacterized protein PFL1_03076 [Pseudozyma flocculosa PF-1]EPQ29321.1 hypothetical protein PFL1_03076 [Pseudozyma flocculosa PF-1]SPO37836.1 uncharacterized protein PSFLO_03313 [Pseudozyma flocculosa]